MRCWPLLFLLILGVGVPSSAREAPPADAPPDELLRYIGKDRFLSMEHVSDPDAKRLGFVDPGNLVARLAKSGASFTDVAEAFRKEYGLPAPAAAALARVQVRWRVHDGLGFDRIVLEPLLEDLAVAIRTSKGALVPVVSAMNLSDYRGSAADQQQVVRMLEPLAAELPEVSKAIARAAPVTGPMEFWLLALENDPSLLKSFVLAKPGRGIAALYPSYEKALKTLKLSQSERADVVNASLDALLSKGLAAEAVAFFQALPRPEQEALLARPQSPRDKDGTPRTDGRGPHLTLPLAAAFFLTGDIATAEAMFRRVDALRAGREYVLLEAALHPERDPFEVLATSRRSHGPWGQVSLWLASTYPAFRADLLKDLAAPPYYRHPEDVNHPPRRATEAMAPLDRKVAQLRAGWQAQLEALPDPTEPQRPEHVSKGIARFLASPVLEPCAVAETSSGPEWKAFNPAVPEGFWLVRAASLERQALALLSGEMDGGYWVMRSEDAGKTWSKPAYLGLRMDAPYFLPREGALRLAGGAVSLDVEVRPLTPGHHGPYRTSHNAKVVRLACDLSVVDRDSDGDGLSDTEEHWLLTDPFHADTDLDGLTDDVDPIPHVPSGGATSLEGLAMLDALFSRDLVDGSIQPRVGSAAGAKLAERPSTAFVVGSRSAFQGLSPSTRLIVLSRKEAAQATERLGDRVRLQQPFVVVNHGKTLVFVSQRRGYGGATYLLFKKADGWHVRVLGQWIS